MRSLVIVLLAAVAAAPSIAWDWPDTPLARRARAWFEQLRGPEAAARAHFAEHWAPAALAATPIDQRLERRRAMLERTGPLTPLAILGSAAAELVVRARQADGDEVEVRFEAEDAPPHRLRGIRLEAGGPPGSRPPPASGPPLEDAEARRRLAEVFDAAAAADSFSGVVLLARAGRPLLERAWGMADRVKRVPATPRTRFNIGSIGKVLTRIAIAQLAERGRLSLDDRLSRFLPDFPHADSITVEMLAEHRSGVGDVFNARYHAMDRSRLRHNRDYLELIRDQPLVFAPGTGRRYSNGGYVLLGEVVAAASGEDYHHVIDRHVRAAAGMSGSGFPIEGESDSTPPARGYTRQGSGTEWRDNRAGRPARGSAAGGSVATASDLLALDRALDTARLCGAPWSDWVRGGPRPDRGGGGSIGAPGFGFAGGAPGISAEWTREGEVTLVVLANLDPETVRPAVERALAIVRRMKT